jgi:hypothetical protein
MRELREFDRQIKEKLEGYEYDLPEGILEGIYERRTASHKMINYFRLRWRRSISILLMIFMSSSVILSLAYFTVIPFRTANTNNTLALAQNTNDHSSDPYGSTTEEEVIYSKASEMTMEEKENDDFIDQKENDSSVPSYEIYTTGRYQKINNKKQEKASARKNKKSGKDQANSSQDQIRSEEEKNSMMDFMQMKQHSGVSYTLTDTIAIPKSDYADQPLLKNKKADRFRVDVYAGPAIVNKMIALHSDEHKAYKTTRKNAESLPVSFSAGIRLNYAINENWSVQGGVSYTNVKEKLRLILKEEVTNMVIDTTIVYVQTPGNPPQKIYEYDTSYYSSLMDHYESADNQYTFIDIPVTLNYTLHKGRWNYSLGAGVIWNIMLNSKGSYINDSLHVTSYSEKNNPYSKSLRLGLTGSVGIRYHLTEKWSVFTEPTYSYYMRPVAKSSLSKDYFNSFYLSSGVSYRF